jgi:hypothetical protein
MALFRSDTFARVAGGGQKASNLDCLRQCFDAHAADDGKINKDALKVVLQASGARLLGNEIAAAYKELASHTHAATSEGNEEAEEKSIRIDRPSVESLNTSLPRYLNDEWKKEDGSVQEFNAYQQTYAAYKVLADSYGNNGLIDILNLRYVLTSCGEDMTDDEFDAGLREIGQSTKGMFQLKKLLTSYHDLAVKNGREDATEQCQEVLSEMESNRPKKANERRQSKILQPGLVAAPPTSKSSDVPSDVDGD